MLDDGLATAERSGHGGHAPFGNGEQGIDDPLPGDHGFFRRQLRLIGPGHTHRPLLQHGVFLHFPFAVLQFVHRVQDSGFPFVDPFHGAALAGRHHDLVQYGRSFLHRTDHIAAGNGIAHFGHGHELPFLLPVQFGHFDAPADPVAGQLIDFFQRPLDSVENAFDQPGSQFHAHGNPGGFHRFPRPQAGGLFIDLDGSFIVTKLDDFTDQALVTDADHIMELHVFHAFGDNQRAGYFHDLSTHDCSLPFLE